MPGKKINEPCCICGATKETGTRLGRFKGLVYCCKHLHQMQRHGKILPLNKTRNRLDTCCVCGNPAKTTWSGDGKEYCQKHYMQLYHHGHLLERTIYDRNSYIDHTEEGYTECITYTKNFNESYHVIIDIDKKEEVSKYKVYTRSYGGKQYAFISKNGKKVFLHRFLMGLEKEEYSINKVVDHINGNSLDNRVSNLRICSHKENAQNCRTNSKVVGVGWLKYNKKWTARIMVNYKGIHLGNFNTYEEAVLARLQKEREICGEYGPNKDLFYILSHPSPVEELKRVFSDGV